MLIRIKVHSGSRKESIVKKSDNSFEVRVKEKAIMGQANQAVISLLSSYLKIPLSEVKLVRGFKAKNKTFKINEGKTCR